MTSTIIADCEILKLSTPKCHCFGLLYSTCWGKNLLKDNTQVNGHFNSFLEEFRRVDLTCKKWHNKSKVINKCLHGNLDFFNSDELF